MPPWGQVGTLRDGRVVRMRIYPEHADALEAAGLSGVAPRRFGREATIRFAWRGVTFHLALAFRA